MSDNTHRFTGRAEDYDRFRQRYPAQAVLERLRSWCGLNSSWAVADVGSGTCMLAEVFLEEGCRVIAVEPNADMRASCSTVREQWPHLEVIDATAEATTLEDASIELVAAGRAFHWFDRDRALAEFRRVLKPKGWLTLVSLGRAHEAESPEREQIAEFEQIMVEHGTDYAYVRAGYRIHDGLREFFPADAAFFQERIPGTQELKWEQFRGQTMSLSVVPREGHPKYEGFQQALRRLFDRHSSHGVLTNPTTCYITAVQLR